MTEGNKLQLIQGDCLEVMQQIKSASIDMVMADPPFEKTACSWDSMIPLEPMWMELKRIVKPNCGIVLNAAQPFTTILMASNMKMWRHNWQWNKNNSAGFALAKIRPFQIVEDVCVFASGKVRYYPQMVRGKLRKKGGYSTSENYGIIPTKSTAMNDMYYPKSLINISNASQKGKVHSTQKPVALMEYLIKTYSKEGETVLDFAAGSFSTAIACINTNRDFIGIENVKKYFDIGKERIEKHLEGVK